MDCRCCKGSRKGSTVLTLGRVGGLMSIVESPKCLARLVKLVPHEFRLNAAVWLGGESLDEFWLLQFAHKYPDMHKKFIIDLNSVLSDQECQTSILT